ncbi:hypothetical protein PtA15_9A451 [Puccinia triticina]|uniref:Uncharacterized protein n=1 Tax=Puccinia triticina TaxID=208348 RepID=A0ABY7CSV6_9BASI|nr:uncharacterized protein PtA15_9A451 [Puccinia triticina]WAQ88324.1 hypothetical protein PtA15_9A451 [Puccinia triticina]WAR60502.1 hypothetical protein PtB15_9B441 [Puccinia triticina]
MTSDGRRLAASRAARDAARASSGLNPAGKSSPKQFGVLKMEAIIEQLRAHSSRWDVRSIYIA